MQVISQVKGFWSKGHIQKPELFTSRDAWLNKVNATLLVKPHWLRPIKSAIFWIKRYDKGFLSAWRCGSVKMTEGELKLNNYVNSLLRDSNSFAYFDESIRLAICVRLLYKINHFLVTDKTFNMIKQFWINCVWHIKNIKWVLSTINQWFNNYQVFSAISIIRGIHKI